MGLPIVSEWYVFLSLFEKFEDKMLECEQFYSEVQYCLTQIDSKLNVLLKNLEMVAPCRESLGSTQKVKAMKLPTLTLETF